MGKIRTYNPKEVVVSLGNHIVTGFAEDGFVSIEPSGDGVTKRVGCDGEIVRSVSPDDTYNIRISLLYGSESNTWLQNRFTQDVKTGDGIFPILIKDLKGGLIFSSDAAWPVRPAARAFGREGGNREWDLQTGSAVLSEG